MPLTDEGGNLRAYCLEVHDTCVSKLLAGREKDFTFIRELPDRGLADVETLAARAELVVDMPQSAALPPRLEKLVAYLKAARQPMMCGPFSSCWDTFVGAPAGMGKTVSSKRERNTL